MSTIPTAGQSILIDSPQGGNSIPGQNAGSNALRAHPGIKTQPGNQLVSFLVGKAIPWELHRSRGYQRRWGEYWRLWRGEWTPNDKNRMSERSRIVAPALSQAIEMTTAELDEAVFSKDVWFDIEDDLEDENKLDALIARDILREDLNMVNAKDAIGEAMLNGAIFGTGIIKMNVEVVKNTTPKRQAGTMTLVADEAERVQVSWEAIRPDEFIPDPAGRSIGEMLGCFHKVKKPLHYVMEKIEQGLYLRSAAPLVSPAYRGSDSDIDRHDPQSYLGAQEGGEVEILEYHGKVPVRFMHAATGTNVTRDANGNVVVKTGDNPLDAILSSEDDDGAMVEAIVTIANQSVLLRAMVNPFTMRDRSIVAFQFEKVPGRFWGRGVAEKGFNPQKALDAEMRARIDSLGFLSSPMIAVDGGRVPRGFKMEIRPGKVWMTQGPPKEVINAIEIGQVQPNTFNQTQELEKMVAMGTGAFDTASMMKSQGSNSSGPSATNVSMMMGAFVKRAKRAIRNVNDNLLEPLLKQTAWRYMQFAPRRYPQDFNFRVMATLGIMAKEIEASQLTQLMAMLPDEFPQVNVAVAKGIIDLASIHNKAEVTKAMQEAMKPPPPEELARAKELEDMQFTSIQADTQGKLLLNQKTMAETRKLLAQALEIQAQADVADEKVELEVERLKLEIEQLDILRDQNRIALARVQIENRRVELEDKRLSQQARSS